MNDVNRLKVALTPNGLGQYFSEMVETVSEKKS